MLALVPLLGAAGESQAGRAPAAVKDVRDTDALAVQVRLDRAGFSPGAIDGAWGRNTERALAAFGRANELDGRGREAWIAALDERGGPVLVDHTISADDVAGPFTRTIPDDLEAQAKLPALNYRSALEALSERFHATEALLERLNPGARFASGDTIRVPNVDDTAGGGTSSKKGPEAASTAGVEIAVSKQEGTLTVRRQGKVIFHAPATTGSEHDPLPIGEWTVTAVVRDPKFHYNPDLFWDADPSHARATLPPGPNNPVGVVWIDLDRPHYGIHGTPEPAAVGHTASHGCVRLTNWDARRVADLVAKGTRVHFVR